MPQAEIDRLSYSIVSSVLYWIIYKSYPDKYCKEHLHTQVLESYMYIVMYHDELQALNVNICIYMCAWRTSTVLADFFFLLQQ